MLNCSDFLDGYSDYRDGFVGEARLEEFRAHLRACRPCAQYDRVVGQGVAVLRDLPPIEPSADFMPRLQHRIFHLEDEGRRRGHRSYGVSAGLMALVAAAIAVVAWIPALQREPTPLSLPPIAAHAPHPVQSVPVLFRSGPLLTQAPPEDALVLPAARTLLTRYSGLGTYSTVPSLLVADTSR